MENRREALMADNEPREVELVDGKTYLWCACGRSQKQPFCDGTHKETDLTPITFKAERSEKAWLCMCKQTSSRPFCDGTHKTVS